MPRAVFVARPIGLARIPLRPADDTAGDEDDLLLSEAVAVASPQATAAARRRPAGAATLTRRGYALRSRTRTTPHGVFAGVTGVTFVNGPTHLQMRAKHRTYTAPAPEWLAALAQSVLDDDGALAGVTLTTSNTVRRRGQRWESEHWQSPESSETALTSIRDTAVVTWLLDECHHGARVSALLTEMIQRWPHAPDQAPQRLLRQLIDAGFLLHDVLAPDLRTDPLGHLLDRGPASWDHEALVRELRTLVSAVDQHPPGSRTRRTLLDQALALAPTIVAGDRVIRTDTVVDATVRLPQSLGAEAARAAGLLWEIGWGTDPLADYHQRFVTRYGRHRSVPVLEATDSVIGLGLPSTSTGPIAIGETDAQRSSVLAGLLADAAARNAREITLDSTTIDRLRAPASARPPRTAEIYVRILAATPGDLDAGRFHLALTGGGSQDAGSTAGRFTAILPDADFASTDGPRQGLVAEIVAAPRTDATLTVAAETGLGERRLPIGVARRPGDLELDDLMLSSNGQHLVLFSVRENRAVIPVLFSRITPQLLPPLARFLALVGHAGERPWHSWSWTGAPAPFTPAVRYRRTWLAPARWVLPASLVSAASSGDWDGVLTAWQDSTRPSPPPIVVTADADRDLPLDLRRSDDRELLRRYVRRGLRTVTTVLGSGYDIDAVLPGPDGAHILDVVVSLDSATPEPARAPTAAPTTRAAGAGLFLPGSQWLALAVPASFSCQHQILSTLAGVAEDVAAHWDRWFWLPYGDELRIRFQGQPEELTTQILPVFATWVRNLIQQRLTTGFSVVAYEQEIERYGGPTAITAAEAVFAADSAVVLDQRTTIPDDRTRLVHAALSAARIATVLGAGAGVAAREDRRLDRAGHQQLRTLRPLTLAAAEQPPGTLWHARDHALREYRELLSPDQRPSCAHDLIHLHCTRTLPGQQNERLIRALATDLTAHRGAP